MVDYNIQKLKKTKGYTQVESWETIVLTEMELSCAFPVYSTFLVKKIFRHKFIYNLGIN
jgi:hypothetical protein